MELSYSNLKSNYDKNTHGVGAIVTTDLEHGVSSSLSNSFNASSGVSINREAPSGVYSLYYVDIRCDAIIKAECNDDSQCKKTVYMYGKRVEKGLAIELSQGKPNNTYFPCC